MLFKGPWLGALKTALFFLAAMLGATAYSTPASLEIDEDSTPVSAVCGTRDTLFLALPNTMFSKFFPSPKPHSQTVIRRINTRETSHAARSRNIAVLEGVVMDMIYASEDVLYLLRFVHAGVDSSEHIYFDALE